METVIEFLMDLTFISFMLMAISMFLLAHIGILYTVYDEFFKKRDR